MDSLPTFPAAAEADPKPAHPRLRGQAIRCVLVLALAGLLGACATRPPPVADPPRAARVEVEWLAPGVEGSMQLSPGQGVRGGAAEQDSLAVPDYPAQRLADRLGPVRIAAHVVIDTAGRVARATLQPESGPDCDAGCQLDFERAVEVALPAWRFEPLELLDWIDGPDEDGDGEPDSVQRGVVEVRPYSLRLRIDFVQVDGRPRVELSGDASP